jgi:hypothetical protein
VLADNGCALEELNLGAQTFGEEADGLGDATAAAFGTALRTNTLLRVLKLERGDITAVGAKALAKGLRRATAGLRRLTLSHNPLGERGVAALASCCNTLARFEASNTGCGDSGAAAFGRALVPPVCLGTEPFAVQRLTHLALGENGITAAGTAALAAGLRSNAVLRVLDLRLNALGLDGVTALGDALRPPGGSALEMLIISDNAGAACQPRSLRGLHRAVAARAVPLEVRTRNEVVFWESEPGQWTGGEYPPAMFDQMRLSLGAMLCHVRRLEQYGD